ncbi:MAG: SH3 domain-containing protein [Chloroflexi bacterium]|nr:SH3 domain-containing protein [Chloroflexota bacterium]MCI0576141.1 SH3 domain-containing protein [Chloroflexota bacterium]MCI0647929.1 SH3 domain-containing protein [Chloroflexota bacterium]MCI0727180.1 SH3 domain-containing protein [Chloroflexota bacterium]
MSIEPSKSEESEWRRPAYRRPPDPRDPDQELTRPRLRRQRQDSREPIPWLWLGMGVVVTVAGMGLALLLASFFLAREPLAVDLPTPTIIRLTAPPSPIPSATSPLATPSPIPTFTPPPTPNLSIAPEEVTAGYYAEVANTENIGVSLRGGPSTDNIRLQTVPEGTVLLVIGGPEAGSNLTWWQVRLPDGTEGWVVSDYLIPAVEPEGVEP